MYKSHRFPCQWVIVLLLVSFFFQLSLPALYYNVSVYEYLYIVNLLRTAWASWICCSLDMGSAPSLFPQWSLACFSFSCSARPLHGHWHLLVSHVPFSLCLFSFIHMTISSLGSIIPTDLFSHLLSISSYLLLIPFNASLFHLLYF